MIKRTLYFGNPAYLRCRNDQLEIEITDTVANVLEKDRIKTIPIEDIGMVVLDHQQITITHALLMALMDNNAAVVTTNFQHLPEGLLLPMTAHHTFTEKVKNQFNASEPLKKSLWQQTVIAKIKNQAVLLKVLGANTDNMLLWSSKVRSGDPDNYEARAAAYFWKNLFVENEKFKRGRYGEPPNNLLNYGYSILRAVIARSLVGSGMATFSGIHHRNKYNPYCLADDIMEPYRPYVDKVVLDILYEEEDIEELTPAIKRKLLIIPAIDITIDEQSSPLMVGAQRTAASLMDCFEGTSRKIVYPVLEL